jgi:glycosyltransferase involved in cell wall biosynthesis
MQNTCCIFKNKYNVADEILYSCIVPIYNQENIVVENLNSIINKTQGNFEIIIILDFCSDNTEHNIMTFLYNYENIVSNFIQITIFKNQYKPLFETKCDNIGFKHSVGKYCLEIQADMKMTDYGYNLQLTKPFNKFDNVIAVSGRCAHNLFMGGGVGKLGHNIETQINQLNVNKNCFYVFETCNRGPLLIDRQKLEELNFLDEEEYFLDDSDHDLMARAYIQKQYICGYVPIDFFAPIYLGSTRTVSKCSINNDEKNRLSNICNSKLGLRKYQHIWKNRTPKVYNI